MSREQKRSLLLIAAAAVLLIGLHFVPVTGWLKLVLYLIPYLLVGGETLVDACKGIYNRQPFDENLLMAVATIGAMVLGDYPEAVSVMLFYQIGELFESYAVGRSRKNIGDLMDIRPDYANVETADGVTRVKPEQVAVGDTIVVKPGERVPLDGTVLTGTSALNMSALTGESAPVDVTEGGAVVSGSVNLSGVLRLRVEKVYAESTVARILELVENSSLKKAHTERFITKFARVYTPSVCGAALALAAVFNFVGLVGMTYISTAVAHTMFNMVDFSGNTHQALLALIAAMIGSIGWGVFCWFWGIPASKSHSLIAGVTGGAIALNGLAGVVLSEWMLVIYGMVFSLVGGFILGMTTTKIIEFLFSGVNRQRGNNERISDLVFMDVPARLAKTLLNLGSRFGEPVEQGLKVPHDLTQEELAQLVGSSRETVNKALMDFSNRGWIARDGRSIIIFQPGMLIRRSRR